MRVSRNNFRSKVSFVLAIIGGGLIPQLCAAPPDVPSAIDFNRDIRPILSDKCYACHGPGRQMAKLRLDGDPGEKSAKSDLGTGRIAIVPGAPDKSELIRRIEAPTPARRMPMGKEALTRAEIDTIRKWIEQGAVWAKHWSFVPPRRPDLPVVHNTSWAKNPIDSFVLQRLERDGLKPSPAADPATLLRRVTFDLTGLPPTPGELDEFLGDSSPQAFEKVVDRLLKSPRYGERMAFPWLEASRYADTHGYQSDGERQMWRWRDWVINALNSNMPFDQFTVEQLAGDLLPNANMYQKIATGFNRNHRGNAEGGIIPEEFQVEYVLDRAETTGTVFLGLTVGCARCHDHKYDPIAQKDLYSLYAYFNNIPEAGKVRRFGNSPPVVKAPTDEQNSQLKVLDAQLAGVRSAFEKLGPAIVRAQTDWEKSLGASNSQYWGPTRNLVAHYNLDGDLSAKVQKIWDNKPAIPLEFKGGSGQFAAGRIGPAASFDGQSYLQGGDITGFSSHRAYDDKYSISLWIYPKEGTGALVTKVADVVDPGGHGLNLRDSKIQYNYIHKWVDDGIKLQSEQALPLNQWHHIALTYDGSRIAEGVKLFVDGKEWKWEVILDDLNNGPPIKREPLRIGGGGGPKNRFKGLIDDVRIYDRDLTRSEVAVLADASSINEIAGLPAAKRTEAQNTKLRECFLETAAPKEMQDAWQALLASQATRNKYYDTLPTVMVMEEMATPRETHILNRGVYDQPGERVYPSLPSFLPAPAGEYAKNRLGLAKWLVDPQNPLTARVTVNRYWQTYFGTGLVKTVEDFGSQGEAPSHPELLDWLATEFIRTKWDVKAMQKLIVMSATYQQSSKASAEGVQRDPENRLLSRGPRFRLPAAMIRDLALAASGLLVNKTGGPSVMPYQPEGLWQELSSSANYVQDHGDNLYRRSMYTFWKRTIPPPTMSSFDASTRESCTVRQNLTNTPLQALDLMNNVTFVEAARVLAQRVMTERNGAPQERLPDMFRLLTGRRPQPQEDQILLQAYEYQRDYYTTHPDAAEKFVATGEYPVNKSLPRNELAAYAAVASMILNLDETITKE